LEAEDQKIHNFYSFGTHAICSNINCQFSKLAHYNKGSNINCQFSQLAHYILWQARLLNKVPQKGT